MLAMVADSGELAAQAVGEHVGEHNDMVRQQFWGLGIDGRSPV
jgi:hypothetical protein